MPTEPSEATPTEAVSSGPVAPFTYVLPLSAASPAVDPEFTGYLALIAGLAELIVVDGSPPEVFAEHGRSWDGRVVHVRPEGCSLMGKVASVMTGVRSSTHERIVIADDDVRFGRELIELVARLDEADVIRPQNYFDPLPWHAVWDSGRSLLNRAIGGGDWPGTLAVRRGPLLDAGGYAGDVMFENYELVKTVVAAGGRHQLARDVFVRRLPPSTRHFSSQRVRQAYDELARPVRLVTLLPILPTLAFLVLTGRWTALRRATLTGAAGVVVAAEFGRRRDGGRTYFPLRCALAAPLWVAERSICVWAALVARSRGGILYRGQRILRAALSDAERQQRISAASRSGADRGAPGQPGYQPALPRVRTEPLVSG